MKPDPVDGLLIVVTLRCKLLELTPGEPGVDEERINLTNEIADRLSMDIGPWQIRPMTVTLPV